jgi:hypothetical protein
MTEREQRSTDDLALDEREQLTTADVAAAAAPTRAKAVEGSPDDDRASASEAALEPLFDEGELQDLRSRWNEIQTGFVDEPRRSVQEADELVATVMKRLAEVFSAERETLEREWTSGDRKDVSTEDLRMALRRYRSFFDRLLSI